jgi:lysophospholipase
MLPERFTQPEGFAWGSFTDAHGAKIRYGSLQPAGEPKGTVVLVSGFRETTEKYFEVIRDLTERGFAVWMMDWRGQGGSERYLDNPQKMFSRGYEEHVETLRQFATEVVKKSSGPLILSAHSMGAHIGLRLMKEHEGIFDSAVLSAPMCDVLTPGYPRAAAKVLVKGAKMARILDDYIPGAHDWREEEAVFEGNRVTSDPKRFAVTAEIYKDKPELKMGEATYGWVLHTFASIGALYDEEYLKSIKTPILMGIAGKDEVVNVAASVRAASLLPNCVRVDIPEAKHELWMERDELRQPWLERVGDFLEERAAKFMQPKKPPRNGTRPPGLK